MTGAAHPHSSPSAVVDDVRTRSARPTTLRAPDLAARGDRAWTRAELALRLAPTSTRGVLVAIEGADGSGKTTFVRALAAALRSTSIPVTTTRLPTTAMRRSRLFRVFVREGRPDRADHLAVQVMHMADRLQHQFETIGPALDAGRVVVSDRYLLATLAALIRHRETDLGWLRDLSQRLVRPDAWFLLQAPSAVAGARIRARLDERDTVLDAEQYDAGNRFGMEIASANAVTCIDTASQPLPAYLDPLVADVRALLASKQRTASFARGGDAL